jgi:ABC-2 type transport system permease protein
MPDKYNQFRAMLSITKASLVATFRSPSSVAFGFGFPLIFILVFGFIGNNGAISMDVGWEKGTDTLNPAYLALKHNTPSLNFIEKPDSLLEQDLAKGDITALIGVTRNATGGNPRYIIHLKTSGAVNQQNVQTVKSILSSVLFSLEPNTSQATVIDPNIETIPGRIYKRIDFILPGQLGFSLLSAGVFGVAFLFFNLRQQLVLKRFFATPIKRSYIVLGEALSRVTFQMITAVIIILIGVLFFKFTLVNGFGTFVQMMILSFLGLLVFMGFGFIVSSVAKNESTIPPFANIFTFPQLLLSGTFFPIDLFPKWLQFLCNLLPLTHFNNAMRAISFEGANVITSWPDVGALVIWGVILYAVAIKVFKWD